jgi:hypothetical protein
MLASEYVPLLACLSCFAVRLDDSTTQIILATLAPYSGERNFYEIYRASTLNHSPTEWQPTHAPSTSGSDTLEAGAPDKEAGWEVRKIDLPPGPSWDQVREAVNLIVDWREDELDEDPVKLAIAVFGVYAKGQGNK